MAQLPMKSEEELCPTNVRFLPNKSNVRINKEEPQDEPIFDLWHTVYKNKESNRYFFHLDNQRFEIVSELIRNALRISPRQPNTEFVTPHVQEELVIFFKQLGKGLMRKGVVPKPKNKKDAASKRSKTITDEGCKHLKIKFKAQEQQSPEAQLLLNLKQQGKESKIQAIQEEIKRKDKGQGSGAALESLDNNSSSNDSSESADDDKTKSERDSDYDASDNESENGDKSDKSKSDEGSTIYNVSDKESNNYDDQNEDFVEK
ncbi:hypothetical protein Tco_0960552 [Tanacetum coccineum]